MNPPTTSSESPKTRTEADLELADPDTETSAPDERADLAAATARRAFSSDEDTLLVLPD